ncbi:MAG TPA: DnaJ family molecular chaperone [Tianweitania sediminis]|jgi:DnaJ like chaperone protein|nr:DnaJ family molecular chaperone [Tianweitania sediminis]
MDSIWSRIGAMLSSLPSRSLSGFSAVIEAIRTTFRGDPELRKRVGFSVAMIALSAKMARADGVVTQDEVRAFHDIFEVPDGEMRNVQRLYQLAQQDTAGFEAYAAQLAGLCGSGDENCLLLEDILDGLFFIAEADGHVHEREIAYLQRIAEIFRIDEVHFKRVLARHAQASDWDPYAVLDLAPDAAFEQVRKRYRSLVAENHPDRLIARGMPADLIAIATSRLAAINAAYEAIERSRVLA